MLVVLTSAKRREGKVVMSFEFAAFEAPESDGVAIVLALNVTKPAGEEVCLTKVCRVVDEPKDLMVCGRSIC
jgi:hypothetical protein